MTKTSPRPGRSRGRARAASVADPAVLSEHLNQGAAHFAAGRMAAAAQVYRAAGRLAPDDIRPLYSLAVIDIGEGRLDRATARLLQVVALAPDHYPAWRNLAAVRQTQGRWEEAAGAYEHALAVQPEAADAREALAAALAILGRTAAAIAQNRRLAETPGTRWPALTRIALLDARAITEGDLADMRRAAADPTCDEEVRTGLWFAIGEVLEQRGQDAAAFEAFAAGNRLKHAALQRSTPPAEVAQAHQAAAEYIRRRYTRAFLRAHEGQGARSAAPIFIVGMPRSGSTLIEQILASHPQVESLGESAILPQLANEAGDSDRPSPARLRGLADRYLASARRAGWSGRGRFVDKTLENYLHLGLIHLAFPGAVILHARRDPMDVCVACYRQLFASGNETLYDLAEIGAEYRRYAGLMEHWREVAPPGRIADVSYEALVADPEVEIPRLVTEAAGLPWDPACLSFFERDGQVRTASAAQVRRPIYRSAVARWRRHAARLGPLIEALGPYAPAEVGA